MRSASDLLTTQEVASLLRVSRASVSRWAKDGVLRPIRVGGVVRFRQADVEALLVPTDAPDKAAS